METFFTSPYPHSIDYLKSSNSMKFNITSVYPYFKDFYTGSRIPSWEDNKEYQKGQKHIDTRMSLLRSMGIEPITKTYPLDPRFA